MPGFFGKIVDAFSPGGVRGQQHQRFEEGLQSHEEERAQEEADLKFHQHMMDLGANPVYSGMVKRPMYNPGNPDLGVGPSNGTLVDVADKARTVNYKDRLGNAIQYELPTPDEQRNRSIFHAISDQMNPAMRAAENEQVNRDVRKKRGESYAAASGKDQANEELRNKIGVGVPSFEGQDQMGAAIASGGQKFLPGEMDDILRAIGSYNDYQSKAKNKEAKADEIHDTHIVENADGSRSVVTVKKSGAVSEKPLSLKAAPKRQPGQITDYQKFEMDRARQNDVNSRVMHWQQQLDSLQEEENKLHEQSLKAGQEMTELGTQLQNGEIKTRTGKDQAKRRLDTLKGQIEGLKSKIATTQSRKKNADTTRRSIMKANGINSDGAEARARVATLDQVRAYAQDQGVSEQQAIELFKKDGIEVH